MKNRSLPLKTLSTLLLAGIAFPHLAATADPLDLHYDISNIDGWFGANAWAESPPPFDSNWIAGSNATIDLNGNLTMNLSESTTIGNLTVGGGSGVITLTGSGGAQSLTFGGGTVNFRPGYHTVGDGFSFQGNFTLASGTLWLPGNIDVLPYSGTATISAGQMDYNRPDDRLGANSNFVINGGNLIIRQQNTTVGSIQMDLGQLLLGRTNAANSFTLSLSGLSGSGGDVIPQFHVSSPSSLSLVTLNLNQSTDTTFGANIMGVNEGAHLALTKSGTGDLTLTGNVEFARVTTVSNGGLFINSTNAVFGNDLPSETTAINVTGGTLGGTGIIEVTGGDNAVIGANGRLAAGLVGTAGQTTFLLGAGTLDLSAATAGSNSGWLLFDLGSSATAGISYDQIALTTGALDIGSGLNFADFDFSLLAGFAPGNYTLFDTNAAIVGSLGDALGELDGYDAELLIIGNNLVLQVIPEPASWLSFGIATMAMALLLRRKRKV